MTTTLPLTRGYVALVDDTDAERASAYKWTASVKKNGDVYARRNEPRAGGGQRCVYLHRWLLSAQPGELVDHKDLNPLNNTRANVRLATKSGNGANCDKQQRGSSRFKGVHFYKARGLWCAEVRHDGKRTHLGYFADEAEAARAYDAAALVLHGTFARTNAALGLL